MNKTRFFIKRSLIIAYPKKEILLDAVIVSPGDRIDAFLHWNTDEGPYVSIYDSSNEEAEKIRFKDLVLRTEDFTIYIMCNYKDIEMVEGKIRREN